MIAPCSSDFPDDVLGLFSFTRRLKSHKAVTEKPNPDLASRIELGLQTRKMRHEQQAASLFDDETPSVPADDDHDAITRIATKSERPAAPNGSGNGTGNEIADNVAPAHTAPERQTTPHNSQALTAEQSGWQSA